MGRHRAEERTDTFHLLFVCTGNICRSPFAEILTRHLLRGRLGGQAAAAFDVSSAGVAAVVGSSMHPDSRAELAPWHLDGAAADGFAARQLDAADDRTVASRARRHARHRSAVVEQCPAALPITFGLREFARLAAAVDPAELPAHPVARAHALVELARLRRGLVPPDPDGDDVPDPIGRPRAVHHHAARLLHAAVADVIDIVSPAGIRQADHSPQWGDPPSGGTPCSGFHS